MPTTLPSRHVASAPGRGFADLLWLCLRLPRLWIGWSERHRQRQALSELDDRLLDDVGLTRRTAECECEKLPWR